MAHDEYEHQRRQTAALERIAELIEMKITADDLRARWDEQESARNASPCCGPLTPRDDIPPMPCGQVCNCPDEFYVRDEPEASDE